MNRNALVFLVVLGFSSVAVAVDAHHPPGTAVSPSGSAGNVVPCPGGVAGPGMMGPGMMGPGMMGPGMMGPGMMGPGMMGPGMMGPGMMGSGMMGPGMMGPGMMGPGMTGRGGYGPLGALNLNADQQKAIGSILDEQRKATLDYQSKLVDQEAKLRDLYGKDTLDANAIASVYEQISKLQIQRLRARIEARNRIFRLLTVEQRNKLGLWTDPVSD